MTAITDLIDNEGAYGGVDPNCFDLTVCGAEHGTLKNVTSDHKVSDITTLIGTSILNDTSKAIDLYAGGKTMKPDKRLSDYGFPKGSARANYVTIGFSAEGGAHEIKEDKTRARVRKFNPQKFPSLKQSAKNDCIYGHMDGVICAAMQCGCAMAPQTMFDYIKSIFDKYQTAFKIICPFHKSVEWDWDYCTEVADMTNDEYYAWSHKRNKRRLSHLKQCPNCKNLCKRKEGVLIFRMNCGKCRGADWCWQCEKKWNNSGNVICGNKECTFVMAVNETLAQCPAIRPSGFKADVPSIRACPRCMMRMKWLKNCKHMPCNHCGKWFCFSCLALRRDDSTYPCSGDKYQCPVKKRQQFGKPDLPI